MLLSLQRSGFRRIPATSADGYFRYIAESIVNSNFTEAKLSRLDTKNMCCILLITGIKSLGEQSKSISELFHIMCFESNFSVG